MSLERFDLLIPDDIKQEIEKRAVDKAIAPRVLGRMLLVEKTKETMGAYSFSQEKMSEYSQAARQGNEQRTRSPFINECVREKLNLQKKGGIKK